MEPYIIFYSLQCPFMASFVTFADASVKFSVLKFTYKPDMNAVSNCKMKIMQLVSAE